MITSGFRHSILALAIVVQAVVPIGQAQDMSAELGALIGDVLKPYQIGAPAPAGSDARVLARTLVILKKEGLLNLPRPRTGNTDIVDRLGKALALGSRSQQFLAEIGAVYDALACGDRASGEQAIRAVYKKAGRSLPEVAALDKAYSDVRAAYAAQPIESERFEIKRPDYTISGIWARASGKMKIEVAGLGDDRQPFRTVFDGDIVAKPDSSGAGLEIGVRPAPAPRTATPEETARLGQKLNGRWTDQEGKQWEIAVSGAAVTLTTWNRNGRQIDYPSRYDLGKVAGKHIINHPDDMEDLPFEVRQQLASTWKPSFGIDLEVSPNGELMEGTWSSQIVTYGGMDLVVKRIHDPYHVRLVLSRPNHTASGAADREKP